MTHRTPKRLLPEDVLCGRREDPRGPGGGVTEGQGSQRGAWAVGQHAGWGDVAQTDSRLRLNTQERGENATET